MPALNLNDHPLLDTSHGLPLQHQPSNLVSEMLVLLVGQIIEPFEKHFLFPLRVQSFPVARLVLEPAPRRVANLKDNERRVGAQEGLDGREVSGHFSRQEQVRPDDISGTVEPAL
jgi:hypothetical protein